MNKSKKINWFRHLKGFCSEMNYCLAYFPKGFKTEQEVMDEEEEEFLEEKFQEQVEAELLYLGCPDYLELDTINFLKEHEPKRLRKTRQHKHAKYRWNERRIDKDTKWTKGMNLIQNPIIINSSLIEFEQVQEEESIQNVDRLTTETFTLPVSNLYEKISFELEEQESEEIEEAKEKEGLSYFDTVDYSIDEIFEEACSICTLEVKKLRRGKVPVRDLQKGDVPEVVNQFSEGFRITTSPDYLPRNWN